MTQTFDLHRGLAQALTDREAAWEFIRDYARDWVRPLSDGDGGTASELQDAEDRLGVALPAALREAYLLLGRRRDLTSNHDSLLGPGELHIDEQKQALVFRLENQGCASWGILLSDLGLPDPAVHMKADLADKQAERWEGWLDHLSWAFVEIILSESLQAPEGLYDFLSDLDPETEQVLQEHCTALPFPQYPSSGPERTRWFLGPDVLLRDDDGCVLLARARTEVALDGVRELLPGDWLNA